MAIEGVGIAFDNNTLDSSATFEIISDAYAVTEWSTSRGRAYEFDRTQTGVATIHVLDTNGDFDPTNTGGPLYGRLEPLKPAGIGLHNPVTDSWSTIYRGFVSSIRWSPYLSMGVANVEIDLVDGLAIAAAAELVAGGNFGTTPFNAGDVYYPEDTGLDAAQTRIDLVLDEIGWPSGTLEGQRQIFTGNVALQDVTYAPRTSALSVMQDAADAEFPGVANLYIDSQGRFTFHGRFARFDPAATNASNGGLWGYTEWQCGDEGEVASNPGTVAPLFPPVTVVRDIENLYTSALCTPKGIDDDDIEGQYIESGAVSAYGLRTWSAEDLLTYGGDGTTALEETYNIANYYVSNYATPRTRVSPLTFRSRMPGLQGATPLWALMCGVDVGDKITVTTNHGGGGGIVDSYYVEGISYRVTQGNAAVPNVEMTLDVSPTSYYTTNPWSA